MELNNPLYKNQGIHVISSLFTVEKGITKVLLIKRKNEPFKDMWALVGGALYNNEDLEEGMLREITEKTGIKVQDIYFSSVFGKKDRSKLRRMVAISYVGVIDSKKVSFLKNTLKTVDADWFKIDEIPELASDHNEILNKALETLKELICTTDILKSLFPQGFTIPEIQKTFEAILGTTYDRRNFRKKLLALDIIVDTGEYINFIGKKPAKLYKFKARTKEKKILF